MARRAHPDDDALIDELMELYVSWRSVCAQVDAAYARWTSATREERAIAHAAYRAALDREDAAAACLEGLATHAQATWETPLPAAA